MYHLRLSDERTEEIRWINFPPIIANQNVTMEHLSPYMRKRFEEEGKQLDQRSLIQTYRGEGLFVFTPLLRFYLELGYEMRNVRLATQYLPEKAFAPFIEKAVQMRIEATYEKDETKANTAKTMVNSSYGKVYFIQYILYGIF